MVYLSICLSSYVSLYLIYLSVSLAIYQMYLSVYVSVYLWPAGTTQSLETVHISMHQFSQKWEIRHLEMSSYYLQIPTIYFRLLQTYLASAVHFASTGATAKGVSWAMGATTDCVGLSWGISIRELSVVAPVSFFSLLSLGPFSSVAYSRWIALLPFFPTCIHFFRASLHLWVLWAVVALSAPLILLRNKST